MRKLQGLGLIHIQGQFVKEPFARKQQWPRHGHFLTTFTQLSEVAEITEEHSIPLIVPTDVSTAVVNKKELVIEKVQEDDNEKSDESEPSSEEEEDLDNAHSNIATRTTDVAGLNEGLLFLVGRSASFGRSININFKFIS